MIKQIYTYIHKYTNITQKLVNIGNDTFTLYIYISNTFEIHCLI